VPRDQDPGLEDYITDYNDKYKNCSLSTTNNGEMTHRKQQK